jgi:hypothetical protein
MRFDYESRDQEFESLRARQQTKGFRLVLGFGGATNLLMGARWGGANSPLCPDLEMLTAQIQEGPSGSYRNESAVRFQRHF